MNKEKIITVSKTEFDKIIGCCKITPTEKHRMESVTIVENKIKSTVDKLFIYKIKKG